MIDDRYGGRVMWLVPLVALRDPALRVDPRAARRPIPPDSSPLGGSAQVSSRDLSRDRGRYRYRYRQLRQRHSQILRENVDSDTDTDPISIGPQSYIVQSSQRQVLTEHRRQA